MKFSERMYKYEQTLNEGKLTVSENNPISQKRIDYAVSELVNRKYNNTDKIKQKVAEEVSKLPEIQERANIYKESEGYCFYTYDIIVITPDKVNISLGNYVAALLETKGFAISKTEKGSYYATSLFVIPENRKDIPIPKDVHYDKSSFIVYYPIDSGVYNECEDYDDTLEAKERYERNLRNLFSKYKTYKQLFTDYPNLRSAFEENDVENPSALSDWRAEAKKAELASKEDKEAAKQQEVISEEERERQEKEAFKVKIQGYFKEVTTEEIVNCPVTYTKSPDPDEEDEENNEKKYGLDQIMIQFFKKHDDLYNTASTMFESLKTTDYMKKRIAFANKYPNFTNTYNYGLVELPINSYYSSKERVKLSYSYVGISRSVYGSSGEQNPLFLNNSKWDMEFYTNNEELSLITAPFINKYSKLFESLKSEVKEVFRSIAQECLVKEGKGRGTTYRPHFNDETRVYVDNLLPQFKPIFDKYTNEEITRTISSYYRY